MPAALPDVLLQRDMLAMHSGPVPRACGGSRVTVVSEELLAARAERRRLWEAARLGQMTFPELMAAIAPLRARWGMALYP